VSWACAGFLEREACETSGVDLGVIFLPGVIAPANVRYGPLLDHLSAVRTLVEDLTLYDGDAPPPGYSITTELDALDRVADTAGLDRFLIFGHSAGGAVALAYAAQRGERLASLAVDEPASDFTAVGDAVYGWPAFDEALALPPAEAMASFMRLQVAPDVVLPRPPGGAPPPWMAKRPAGIAAFVTALRNHHVSEDQYARFAAPVYFSRGSRTHGRWAAMQGRLAGAFPDFTGEVFDGLHHLNPAHQAEPGRVAATLSEFWERAEANP
jgi:pimeloyl-ACP methyl ester carboxylesterase